MDEAKRSLAELETIWVDVLRGERDDLELAAMARETRARLLVMLAADDGMSV